MNIRIIVLIIRNGLTITGSRTQFLRGKKYFGTFLALALFLSGASQRNEESLIREYSLMPVNELITSIFRDKEVVFLGESHRIRQQVELVGRLIPVLQKTGVHILFSEFANYSDTKLADSLLTAENYDESVVREILHRSEWDWAWQEYADLYKAAWTVNRRLGRGEAPFRIIGLQPDHDYSAIQKPEDWDNDEKRRNYWNYAHNKSWLEIIETEALDKKLKAAVHCGLHHAFTKFCHPIVISGKFIRFEQDREGTSVYRKYPGKTATVVIYQHHPQKPDLFTKGIPPFNGVIDSITSALPGKFGAYGFLTRESVLGSRTDTASFYSMGYGKLVLRDFCDAFIVTGHACDYVTTTLMENFISEKNLANTVVQAFPYLFSMDLTVKSCNDSLVKWSNDEKRDLERMKGCR